MKLFITLLLTLFVIVPAQAQFGRPSRTVDMMTAVTSAPTTGSTLRPKSINRTFQAFGSTSAGAGTATVIIEGSNHLDPTAHDWATLATFSLSFSNTSEGTEGVSSSAAWRYVRARLTAISGTDAAVTVILGIED